MFRNNVVTTFGTAVVDILFYTQEGRLVNNRTDALREELLAFEVGAKLASDNVHTTFGGGAANAAVAFARMGLRCGIVTTVGTDAFGDECLKNLKNNHVATSLVARTPQARTGLSFIVYRQQDRKHLTYVYRGASSKLKLPRTLPRKMISPWFYVASLSGDWRSNLRKIFSASKKTRIAWNPGGEQIAAGLVGLRQYLRKTCVFMVNLDEARELFARSRLPISDMNASLFAKKLHSYGPEIVIITCGHKGAYAYDGKRSYYQKAIIKKTVNKTGAGDAFGSGFIAGLIFSRSMQQALHLAAHMSYSVVQHRGAQIGLLRKRDISRLNIGL